MTCPRCVELDAQAATLQAERDLARGLVDELQDALRSALGMVSDRSKRSELDQPIYDSCIETLAKVWPSKKLPWRGES